MNAAVRQQQRTATQMRCPAELSRLPELRALLERFCAGQRADAEAAFDLQLMLEEACVNVIHHAYPAGAPGPLTLRLRRTHIGGQPAIEATLEDQGPPYNPLEQAPPDLRGDVEQRSIGGLGVHLIRSLADELAYRRDPLRGNVLRFARRLAGQPES